MSEDEKKKNEPPPKPSELGGYAVGISGIVTLLFGFVFIYLTSSARFQSSSSLSIIYSLAMFIHNSALWQIALLAMWIGTGLFALLWGERLIHVLAIWFSQAVWMFMILVLCTFRFNPTLTPMQTIAFGDHVYHYIHLYNFVSSDHSDNRDLIVECDSSGVACRVHTAYDVGGHTFDWPPYETKDHLFIDEADQALKLQRGDEIILINIEGGI